jgi:hypothetical protein
MDFMGENPVHLLDGQRWRTYVVFFLEGIVIVGPHDSHFDRYVKA